MKKIALLLVVLSCIGRVVCCGQKISLGAKISQLEEQQARLIGEIDGVYLQNTQALSITRLDNSSSKKVTIAQSQLQQ